MNTTILDRNRSEPDHQLYSMFYVRADNCDGENSDLAVIAVDTQHAIEIWAEHYYEDEGTDPDFIAHVWQDEGKGVMTLASYGDLEQMGLEPGPIQWGLQPVPYHRPDATELA